MDNDGIVIVTGADDNMSTIPTYSYGPLSSADIDSITIDTSSITSGSYTFSSSYEAPSVSLDTNGITMKPDADLRIGDRSLKDFMDRVEERLNILRPNPKLEDKWDELAELGKRYRELEAEILEKERMWNILKESK